MTRVEFEGLLDSYEIELGQTADSYEFNVPAGDPDAARAAILAAYDDQAARIAELEAVCDSAMDALANGDLVGVHRHLLPVWSRDRG